jgi:hypothetical protein
LHPQQRISSLGFEIDKWFLIVETAIYRVSISKEKNKKKHLRETKKHFMFAPRCRDRDLSRLKQRKTKRHVHRHIELTANKRE